MERKRMEPKTTYRLGMGQMLVEGGRRDENLARADRMIRRAASTGCSIVVLPECLDLAWTSPTALDLAAPIPGPHSDVLADAARDVGIYVVGGLT
jgi:predicted amidohydrolase